MGNRVKGFDILPDGPGRASTKEQLRFYKQIVDQIDPLAAPRERLLAFMLEQPDFIWEDEKATKTLRQATGLHDSYVWRHLRGHLCYHTGLIRSHRPNTARETSAYSLDFDRAVSFWRASDKAFVTPDLRLKIRYQGVLAMAADRFDVERPDLVENMIIKPDPPDITAVRFGVSAESVRRLGLTAIR